MPAHNNKPPDKQKPVTYSQPEEAFEMHHAQCSDVLSLFAVLVSHDQKPLTDPEVSPKAIIQALLDEV